MSTGVPDDTGVNLLWTGGWDSTFQLLRLLLLHGRHVVPHYLMDGTRPSTAIELKTMDRIRARLADEHPEAASRLAQVRAFRVAELASDPDVDQAFAEVRRRWFLGDQYAWLASYCRQHAIADMELCIHRDDKAHAVLDSIVRRSLDAAGHETWRCDPRHAQTAQYRLFGGFSLPVFELSKLDMAAQAQERGWRPVMDMTWFCHRPRGERPCGMCNPCLYTIEEGLGWRIPPRARVASVFYRMLVRPLKAPAKAVVTRLRALRAA